MSLYISNSKNLFLIKRIFVFSFVLFLLLWAIKEFMFTGVSKVEKGQIATVRKIVTHQQNPNIAVFGSSVAWVHFNPKIISSITGKSCYNFGLNGTPLTQYQGLLKEFIEYSDSKVIVIAGTFSEFYGREAVAELYRFTPYLDNENLYQGLEKIDPELLWKMKYIPFYPLTTLDYNFFQYSLYGHLGMPHPNDKNEVKGFVPQYKTWSAAYKNGFPQAAIINDTVVHQFKEIVTLANEKGKKVIFVLPPIYFEGAKLITNLDQVRKTFQDIAGPNNYFFDFTKSKLCLDRSKFYNNTHLNATGADLFSREFSNELLPLTLKL